MSAGDMLMAEFNAELRAVHVQQLPNPRCMHMHIMSAACFAAAAGLHTLRVCSPATPLGDSCLGSPNAHACMHATVSLASSLELCGSL
jgi:hypothetical protein